MSKSLTETFIDAALTEETNLNEAFTRQHYEALAKAIKTAYEKVDGVIAEQAIETLANDLAEIFVKDNSRFDKGFFLSKCGL